VGEDVFDHPQVADGGEFSVQFFAHLAHNRVGTRLAEFNAAAERAVEDDIPRRIVAAKDQQPILVQKNAEDDRANPRLVLSAPCLP